MNPLAVSYGQLNADYECGRISAKEFQEIDKKQGIAVATVVTTIGGEALAAKTLTKLAEALGPAGNIFSRERLGGSSILNINHNDSLRIGWGWIGSARSGQHVFRISGEWVERLGVKSGHIDLFTMKP